MQRKQPNKPRRASAPPPRPRTSMQALIVGTNGTGKTTYLLQTLSAVSKSRRAIVVDYENAEKAWQPFDELDLSDRDAVASFTGIRRVNWALHEDESLSLIKKYYRNGILVLDDCRTYLKSSLEDQLHQLLIRRRQYMLDVFAVAHSFQDIPPRFFQFTTHVVLFRITRPLDDRKKMLANPASVAEALARIDAKSKTNPHYFELIKF